MTFVRKVAVCVLFAFTTAAMPANAQTYPNRIVKVVAPNPPGGAGDLLARMFGTYFAEKTGQSVVIENVTGAAGNLAMEAVAKSPPDGYSIVLVNNTMITVNPFLFKNMRVDPFKDLVPVAAIGDAPQLLFVNSKVPAKNLDEFLAMAKATPGKISYASPGIGTTPHLSCGQIGQRKDVNLLHVPYRGVVPAITDIVAGHVNAMCVSYSVTKRFVENGTMRALVTLTPKRVPYLPDVPTADEVGLKGLHMGTWFGLFVPTGTPQSVIDTINAHVRGMLNDPESLKKLKLSEIDPMPMTAAEYAAFVKSEIPKYEQAVKAAGITAK